MIAAQAFEFQSCRVSKRSMADPLGALVSRLVFGLGAPNVSIGLLYELVIIVPKAGL